MQKLAAIFLFLSFLGSPLCAQEISLTASAPRVVAVGEQFRLVFTVNQQADQFIPPDLGDLQVLMGPSSSYSSSTSIVNGKMTQKVSYTYTYIVQAASEGIIEIPPATVVIDNKNYNSEMVSIEVVEGNLPEQPGTQESQVDVGVIDDNDLFIRVLLNRSEVYQGQHIIATVKIYSRVNLSGFEEVKFPAFSGFLKEDVEVPALRSLERENVDGQIYGTGVLSQVVLFPQKTGEIVIEPVEITALVQQRVNRTQRNFFDDFFDSFQTLRREIRSPELKILVKPLPEGAPAGFSGAVGSFRMNSSLDKTELKANEAVTLNLQISGNGNLKLISAPQIDLPLDFESYDPKSLSNLKSSTAGVQGSRSFEYLMIPRFAGDYRIPALSFSYFDPAENAYRTLTSPSYDIQVQKSETSQSTTVFTSPSQEDIRFIGRDIRFIHSGSISLKAIGKNIFGSLFFVLVYIVSAMLFILVLLMGRKSRKEKANKQLIKNKKANKVARKRLKSASRELKAGKKEAFYKAILEALWGYLSDKLGIPVSSLSRDNIDARLQRHGVDEENIRELLQLVDLCEFAQYAPVKSESELAEVYRDTVRIISTLEQKLK